MRWMNQTKSHVPSRANTNEKAARLHSVEDCMNSSAIRMPNLEQEIVAPVVGDTNLFMHSCCMIRPATLMPMPVQRIASRRGRRETSSSQSFSVSPRKMSAGVRSITPTNSDAADKTDSSTPRTAVLNQLFSCSFPVIRS